ncbi:sulfate transporter family-domain-containing protein [Lipomyces oligophaga]|uniref:sulfate transporter family-domain-containing protein n=1 Tax=Lipomyces oligophaga TaxID=45792 RepID=UPI0034CF5596
MRESEDRAQNDAVSVHSTASSSFPGMSFFRNRVLSFGSASHDIAPAASFPGTGPSSSGYTALSTADVPDPSTILGAPRRSGSPAHLHHRHRDHHSATYGALASSTSLSSCATQVQESEKESESPDPLLFSKRRRDRFRAKSRYYLKYYLPVLTWLPHYPVRAALAGDIIAGLTVASFNIPLSLSYARTLCHVPERYGLLGFAFPQLVYAFMGTVPVMITGPEPAISVMIGQAIAPFIYEGNPSPEEVERRAIMYIGLITSFFAFMYLVMGFLRLGFLDSLLSTGFLRGFISAVGIVLTMDTLISSLGLSAIAAMEGIPTASAGRKLGFILTHLKDAHGLTAAIAFTAFGIIIGMRTIRMFFAKKYKFLVYIPDILMIVIFSIIMSYKLDWAGKGAEIVGMVDRPNITMVSPVNSSTFMYMTNILTSAFIIALLGFFQSAVIAKNIFPDPPTNPHLAPPRNPTISTNRELIALGTANLLGMFMFALPSIGGYGRSKANKFAGARTQLSSMVFAFSTIIVAFGLLPLIYYLPRAVLSAVLGLICVALLEELPGDLVAYFKMHAWGDLAMVTIIIAVTLGLSLQLGITLGIVISLVQILKHATKARIQVLARVPGTASTFRNADLPSHDVSEDALSSLEHLPNVLLVRFPEPLSFANSSELQQRLRRLEKYGTMRMHPSLPAMRRGDQNVIMDMEGMDSCDVSAVKVLLAIVEAYRSKGKYVLFVRVPATKKILLLFKRSGLSKLLSYNGHRPAYFESVTEALEALDECVYEIPGHWDEEEEEREIEEIPEPELEPLEEDSVVTDIESSESDSIVDEKTHLKREMV